MISKLELRQILLGMEQDRIEKTVSVNDQEKFGEAICSFANDLANHGLPGYLVVGAHDNGVIAGLTITEQNLQTLLSFRTDGRIVPPPSLTVSKFEYPEGELAVVEVQPHFLPPVRFKGRVCVRAGIRRGYASEADERLLVEKRTSFARTFDVLPCKGSGIDDISVELFKLRYLPSAIDPDTLAENGRALKDQLASLKFYDNENDYRNPVLAEAAKNLGFINGFNVGVKAAKSSLANNGNPEPIFVADQPDSFSVKVFKRS